ncbi:hypothetical protein GCM10009799_14240 [Nocardiopsis rhodophaea]|uniref:Ornithine cyclodeaminase n=1 Tax=Nocardiopsis rhodophaea TaxID=280238 RepID=A0ABN2SN91_9ACTN
MLLNAYGPTECSDDVTHFVVGTADPRRGHLPVGGPIADTALYVLREDQGRWTACDVVEAGELFVGAVGVGRGYLGDPERTRAAFFRDRFADTPTGRIYRTGDAVTLLPEGVSAVLLLNDCETGYPVACLEAAQISAARTAASAVLAGEHLSGGRKAGKLAVIGAGIIARNILEFFAAREWSISSCAVYDLEPRYAGALAGFTRENLGISARVAEGMDAALCGADVVVLATTAGEPYILDRSTFAPGQVVLNISLRDIGPDIILDADNVVDDGGRPRTSTSRSCSGQRSSSGSVPGCSRPFRPSTSSASSASPRVPSVSA